MFSESDEQSAEAAVIAGLGTDITQGAVSVGRRHDPVWVGVKTFDK